jgi:hypothetical protein
MFELVLAALAGALIMGVAIECWRIVEEYDRANRDERDRAKMRRALERTEEPPT